MVNKFNNININTILTLNCVNNNINTIFRYLSVCSEIIFKLKRIFLFLGKKMNRKQPIRTYQRKTAKKPFVSSLVLSPKLKEKCNSMKNNHFDKSGTHNDSLNYDPFETTFDRIAKGAV